MKKEAAQDCFPEKEIVHKVETKEDNALSIRDDPILLPAPQALDNPFYDLVDEEESSYSSHETCIKVTKSSLVTLNNHNELQSKELILYVGLSSLSSYALDGVINSSYELKRHRG